MKNYKRFAPTVRERSALTRIYGAEENWLGVATESTKKRRAVKNGERRRSAT